MTGVPQNPRLRALLILGSCTAGEIPINLTDHSGSLGILLIASFVVVDITVLGIYLAERRTGRRGPEGASGPDGDGRPLSAVAPARRWRALGAVSRLMPRAAGRRWLGEAESSLFEMDPGQRRAAVRSYLRSAPRVVAMTWGREVARRTRRRAG
jgi:hypothetical protein